jgi:hypothetical protein
VDQKVGAKGLGHIQLDLGHGIISYGEKTQKKSIPLNFRFLDDGGLQIAGTTQIENNGSYRNGAHLLLLAQFSVNELVSLQNLIGSEVTKRYAQQEKRLQNAYQEKWAADRRLKEMNETVEKLVTYTKQIDPST